MANNVECAGGGFSRRRGATPCGWKGKRKTWLTADDANKPRWHEVPCPKCGARVALIKDGS